MPAPGCAGRTRRIIDRGWRLESRFPHAHRKLACRETLRHPVGPAMTFIKLRRNASELRGSKLRNQTAFSGLLKRLTMLPTPCWSRQARSQSPPGTDASAGFSFHSSPELRFTGKNPAHSDFVAASHVPRDGKTVGLSPGDCRLLLNASACPSPCSNPLCPRAGMVSRALDPCRMTRRAAQKLVERYVARLKLDVTAS